MGYADSNCIIIFFEIVGTEKKGSIVCMDTQITLIDI
jgi:hypothetical protein